MALAQLTLAQTIFAVLTGLAVLFAVATAFGTWFATRAATPVAALRIGQMNSRLRSGWTILLLFTVAFALGDVAIAVVFAIASFFALREFVALTPIKPADHWALVLAFYVVIPMQYVLAAGGGYGIFAIFIPVYVFLTLPVLMALRQNVEHYLQRIAKVQWGLMITVYCVSHAPVIARLEPPGHEGRGALLLLFFLLTVQMADLFAVIGSAVLGGTQLRSNRNKTRPGALAGGVAATLTGTALWWMTPFEWWQALLMAAATVTAGFMGGLVLASVKQSMGATDQWSATEAAEAVQLSRGVLGRLEALSFAAPVFFHLTVYFFLP
jgi:phosphatidate cytidylyltransferase